METHETAFHAPESPDGDQSSSSSAEPFRQATLNYGTSEGRAQTSWTPRQFSRKQAEELRRASDLSAGTWANDDNRRHKVREYTLGEEIANSISHGIGAALSIAAIVLCTVFAVHDGGGVLLVAALVYSISMFLEYLMSTLYHAIAVDGAKRVFKVLDHSCIYLFIAGSYTPYCLVSMAGVGGLKLGVFVWVVALVGVALEAFWTYRPRWVSAVIYVLLGWAVLWYIPVLVQVLPSTGFWLLFVGGLCYTVGAVFYVLKKIPYMHTVFHLLILAGSIFQFFATLLFVL